MSPYYYALLSARICFCWWQCEHQSPAHRSIPTGMLHFQMCHYNCFCCSRRNCM